MTKLKYCITFYIYIYTKSPRLANFEEFIIFSCKLMHSAQRKYTVGQKTGPFCFTACNFGSIDQIGTKFGKINAISFLTFKIIK